MPEPLVEQPFIIEQGWWQPGRAPAAHYLRNGRSLCGKFMSLGTPALSDAEPPENACPTCKARWTAEHTHRELGGGG